MKLRKGQKLYMPLALQEQVIVSHPYAGKCTYPLLIVDGMIGMFPAFVNKKKMFKAFPEHREEHQFSIFEYKGETREI